MVSDGPDGKINNNRAERPSGMTPSKSGKGKDDSRNKSQGPTRYKSFTLRDGFKSISDQQEESKSERSPQHKTNQMKQYNSRTAKKRNTSKQISLDLNDD